MADRERTLRLAAEIISAHATNNAVPSAQLPALIQQVFSSLATVEQKQRNRRSQTRPFPSGSP